MRKAFEAVVATGVMNEFAAASSHPFLTQETDARTIEHGDGRISSKMRSVPAAYNKYDSVMFTDDLFVPPKSKLEHLSEYFFGASESAASNGATQHKLGQGSNSLNLRNPDGTMWVGPMIMGGVKELEVVYDTGSDWLVIESATCSNCEGDKYDPATSSGNAEKKSYTLSERNYGSASLEGYEFYDKVCISLNTCIDDFEFFLIESQRGISEPIDGILGLSRNNAFHIAPDQGNRSGPLYIENLYKAGKINANKFSFYFNQPSDFSWMDMGEPDTSLFKPDAEVVRTQMIDPDFFWGFMNTGIAIGSISNAFVYGEYEDLPREVFYDNALYSIIDTGSTALVISVLYYEALINELFKSSGVTKWTYTQGAVFTPCESKLQPLFFQIDGAWVEARAEDYMYEYPGGPYSCLLFVMPANMAMNILGMPVHVDYYTVHDPVKGTVDWAPHYKSPKADVQVGPVPRGDKVLKAAQMQEVQSTSVLIQMLLAAAVCFGAIYLWKEHLIPEFAKNGYSTNLTKLYSGLYFLGVAGAHFYGLELILNEILDDEASETSYHRSAMVEKSQINLLGNDRMMLLASLAALAIVARAYYSKQSATGSKCKKNVSEKSLEEEINERLGQNNSLE